MEEHREQQQQQQRDVRTSPHSEDVQQSISNISNRFSNVVQQVLDSADVHINPHDDYKDADAMKRIIESEVALNRFLKCLRETMESLWLFYDKCDEYKAIIDDFDKNIFYGGNDDAATAATLQKQVETIKTWHKEMIPFYAAADAKNVEALNAKVPFLSRFDLPKIWGDFGEQSRAVFWEYIKRLNKHSRRYNLIPSNLFNRITQATQDIMNQVNNGETRPESWTFDQYLQYGRSLISGIEANDIKELSSNVQSMFSNIDINEIFQNSGLDQIFANNSPLRNIINSNNVS